MEDANHVPVESAGSSGSRVADTGRPRIDFDLNQLENLGAISATQPEVAAWFRVSLSIIEKRLADEETRYDHMGHRLTFREIYEMGMGRGKASLRRVQMDAALGGNTTMQIWLGKNILGQRDNLDTQLTGANGGSIDVTVTSRQQIEARIAGVLAAIDTASDPGKAE